MKYRILVAFALTFAASAAVRAQSPGWNPIPMFPSVQQIQDFVKGDDEFDEAAKEASVLKQFADIAMKLYLNGPPMQSGMRFTDEVINAYNQAATFTRLSLPAELKNKYAYDAWLREDVMQRFFKPEFKDYLYKIIGEQPPTGTRTTSATASNPKPKAPEVNVPDNYKLFNGLIKIGQPLDVPRCQNTLIGGAVILANVMNCQTSEFPQDRSLITVWLSLSSKADWMTRNVLVRLNEGRVERVVINTVGRKAQDAIIRDLTAKYGPPTITKLGKVTPSQGNPFDIREPEWDLPGLRVEFSPIERNKFGNYDDIDGAGFVRIETQDAYKRRIEAEKKKKSVL